MTEQAAKANSRRQTAEARGGRDRVCSPSLELTSLLRQGSSGLPLPPPCPPLRGGASSPGPALSC